MHARIFFGKHCTSYHPRFKSADPACLGGLCHLHIVQPAPLSLVPYMHLDWYRHVGFLVWLFGNAVSSSTLQVPFVALSSLHITSSFTLVFNETLIFGNIHGGPRELITSG